MRPTPQLALLWALLTLSGCRARQAAPEQPMPPNTVLLSQMMRELSAQPGFTERLLAQLDVREGGKKGAALLTPSLLGELRRRILGKDWQGLDRFPGWTMREINPTVHLADRLLGKDPQLEALSAVHPGAPPSPPASPPAAAHADRQAGLFLDLGPYPLDRAQTISLDVSSSSPAFTTEGLLTPLGMGVTRGDGPNDLAPEHAESQRLADVLNRLSANRLNEAQPFVATLGGHTVTSPEELVAALTAAGHTVAVHDARYFANFGHLHYAHSATDRYRGADSTKDVMMPFWVNTGMAVPHTGGLFHRPRPLLVPVSHAELEWHIRGPHLHADVSHYFGVDGKAEWRTMDTLDQAWVLRRYAHTYTGAEAMEVTRLVGLLTLAYMHQHARRPNLPFGGYYTLGVCQDPVSAVETKLTGRSTLFPNTADTALFDDPRDAEINALFAAIPEDRDGAPPPPERIFGSLPAEPGADGRFAAITIPGLRRDLAVSYAAWQAGELERTHGRLFYIGAASGTALAALCLGVLAWRIRTLKRGAR